MKGWCLMKKIPEHKKTAVFILAAVFSVSGIGMIRYVNNYYHSDESMMEDDKMTYERIPPQKAKEIMDTEQGYIILDVRTQAEYSAGHIKGAICLPNENIIDEPEMLPDKDQMILVYCRSGNRSRQAAQKLAEMGYANVLEFGGILDWPYQELTEGA